MSPRSTRAVGIVIHDHNILLMRRVSDGKEYYTFPGGGVEENETVEDAVVRELAEETSITVKLDKLLYIHEYKNSSQYFYLCDCNDAVPKLADDSEEKSEVTENNIFDPQWIPVDELPKMLLYPLEIRDWLVKDLEHNFQSEEFPKKAILDEDKLRQAL